MLHHQLDKILDGDDGGGTPSAKASPDQTDAFDGKW